MRFDHRRQRPVPLREGVTGEGADAEMIFVGRKEHGAALGGALLRIVAGGEVLARGMSDWRGEALVPVVGVPVTTWSEDEGAVVVTSIAATVEVYFDPALGTRTPIVDVRAGRQPAGMPLLDPADVEDRRAALPTTQQNLSLAARGALNLNLGLDLP